MSNRHGKLSICIILVFCLFVACGDLSKDIEKVRHDENLPALGIAVIKDGEIEQVITTGTRAINSVSKVTTEDRWHIGSLSKGMTATLAAIMVSEGKIAYSSTIEDLMPELKGHVRETYLDVTLKELLNQTAALPKNEALIPSWESFRRDTTSIRSQRVRFLKEYLSMESNGKRGEYRYSNGHYMTIGALLEAATDKSWEDLITEKVFNPLGMQRVGFGPPGTVGLYDQPKGHKVENDSFIPLEPTPDWDNPKIVGPSGTIHASLYDYSLFILEHLNSFKGQSKLLTSDEYSILHSAPEGSHYAMGWEVMATKKLMGETPAEVLGDKIYMHGGSNGYWIAGAFLFPEIDMGVVIVSNAGGKYIVASGQKALQKVMEHYYGAEILSKMAIRKKLPSCSDYLFPTAKKDGAEATVALYYQVKDSLSDKYSFGPGELSYIGHYYTKQKLHKDAGIIYQLEAIMFPKQGQGDYFTALYCYLPLGDTLKAIEHYKLSIQKQPEFFIDEELEAQLGLSPEDRPKVISH